MDNFNNNWKNEYDSGDGLRNIFKVRFEMLSIRSQLRNLIKKEIITYSQILEKEKFSLSVLYESASFLSTPPNRRRMGCTLHGKQTKSQKLSCKFFKQLIIRVIRSSQGFDIFFPDIRFIN